LLHPDALDFLHDRLECELVLAHQSDSEDSKDDKLSLPICELWLMLADSYAVSFQYEDALDLYKTGMS
jgi:hypothetical protein